MHPVHPRRFALPIVALAATTALAGCSFGGGGAEGELAGASENAAGTPFSVTPSVSNGATDVKVDTTVKVAVAGGTIKRVTLVSPKDKIPGQLASGDTAWRASAYLSPGVRYTVAVVAVDASGAKSLTTSHFRTQPLTLNQQTFPSVLPLAAQTVGVGMPVIVTFDEPIFPKFRAGIERHLAVAAKPAQQGSWYWMSDREVHWRPRTYWKPHTRVTVRADIKGVPAGNGVFGQLDRTISFRIGASHIYKVNMTSDQMKVVDGGKVVRTFPVTTGKVGFTTRSGVKLIMAKQQSVDMDASTVGISKSSSQYYNLMVYWAMRLTNSGEFVHAAPWSQADQGHENVSHGCTGLSTADAEWLFKHSQVGDVVDEVGSRKHMTLTNGWGDWNLSWKQWLKGSALYDQTAPTKPSKPAKPTPSASPTSTPTATPTGSPSASSTPSTSASITPSATSSVS